MRTPIVTTPLIVIVIVVLQELRQVKIILFIGWGRRRRSWLLGRVGIFTSYRLVGKRHFWPVILESRTNFAQPLPPAGFHLLVKFCPPDI